MAEHRRTPTILGGLSSLIPLSLFVGLLWFPLQIADGHTFRIELAWVPSLGVALSFAIDGLSLLFAFIICCVGFFVSLYAVDYLPAEASRGRFYAYLHLFLISMLGLVTADNFLALFVFWESTTIFSYLLIGFEHESAATRRNARQALLVTGGGGLALLIGGLLLGSMAHTYELSRMVPQAAAIRSDPLYGVVLTLVLLGAFTKSAQMPFHFWLPNAMSAPTPISAFLHSATMVKAGIYLLARLHPILGATPAWTTVLVVVGGTTALTGALLAVTASDLKRILAFTTIMALGVMTMFLGGRSSQAMTAAMTFLMVHSLYKSALFLVVGIIDHQTGTRRIESVGGLLKPLPVTALATAAAALSMAGFPLFFGFVGKEIMYAGALAEELYPVFCTTIALLANALMTAVAGLLMVRPFLGPSRRTPRTPREAPWTMWLGPVFLGGLGVAFGIVPDWIGRWAIQPAVMAFHPTGGQIHLQLFHGINTPLLLSVVTLSLGTLCYLRHRQLGRGIDVVLCKVPFRFEQLYTVFMAGIAGLARIQTRVLQSGSLHRYLCIIIGSVLIGVGLPFVAGFMPFDIAHGFDLPLPGGLVVGIILSAVVFVVRTESRLLAICSLGVVGAGIAMLFLMHGAPDVALTQLLVETLTVIIVSLVLLRLPRLSARQSTPVRVKILNGTLAIAFGTLIAGLILTVNQTELDRTLSAFFEANSYVAAHGRNVVNVILVDFRSLDTLGEITVVALAGLAGYALIRKRRGI